MSQRGRIAAGRAIVEEEKVTADSVKFLLNQIDTIHLFTGSFECGKRVIIAFHILTHMVATGFHEAWEYESASDRAAAYQNV